VSVSTSTSWSIRTWALAVCSIATTILRTGRPSTQRPREDWSCSPGPGIGPSVMGRTAVRTVRSEVQRWIFKSRKQDL